MSEHAIPVDILDDLSSRFIINIPREERTDPIRLFFQIELAHWFYIDHYRSDNAQLKACGMKEFTRHMLNHIPNLSFMLPCLDTLYDQWKDYKMSVPTFGAIILNEDMTKVLLVQSFFEKASWGFPKGKVNEEEDPVKCAVREVLEETGLDISKIIRENQYIESFICEQTIRLYIISGIKETQEFHPKTQNEIRCVEWFTINDLPTNKKDITPKIKMGYRPNSFFMILPFMRKIKQWIQEKREDNPQQPSIKRRTRHKSAGDIASSPNTNGDIKAIKRRSATNDMGIDIQNLRISAQNLPSSPRNGINGKEIKVTSKYFYRRQLFDNGHDNKTKQKEHIQLSKPDFKQIDDMNFIVPRWLNFKLDRASLIECFDI